jgi:hypothetical protein
LAGLEPRTAFQQNRDLCHACRQFNAHFRAPEREDDDAVACALDDATVMHGNGRID